jgi:phosphoribosylamine---glycine ligase
MNIVFFGLINVQNEPYVIEYNCRFGDPETEVILPRLENDLVELFLHCEQGTLDEVELNYSALSAATIMCVSGGYPESFTKGFEINGLEEAQNCMIFQAGTAFKDNAIVTSGGRVLAITSMDTSIKNAVNNSLEQANKINYSGMYYRKDIGWEFE